MIYSFLQEALRLIPLDKPFRGPTEYKKDEFDLTTVRRAYINDFV